MGKTTDQSSTYFFNYPASKAVNGVYNDFTHTADNEYPSWWRVDLGDIYNIGQIILHNRKDSCCRKSIYAEHKTICVSYVTLLL